MTILYELHGSLAELRADYDRLIAARVAEERLACARLAESFAEYDEQAMTDGAMCAEIGEHTARMARAIATAIRARQKKEKKP